MVYHTFINPCFCRITGEEPSAANILPDDSWSFSSFFSILDLISCSVADVPPYLFGARKLFEREREQCLWLAIFNI